MNRPPLATFLDESGPDSGQRDDGGAVNEMVTRLLGVLSEIVERRGVDDVAAATDVDRALLESLRDDPTGETVGIARSVTLENAAEILAVESGFHPTAIRGRIRDHLVVHMGRRSIDAATLSARYGFGDPTTLRERIEGERPLALREYARMRVALE